MPFNVIKESIDEFFGAAVSRRGGDEQTLALLNCALAKPLLRQLTTQEYPDNLTTVQEVDKDDPGWLRQAFNEGKAIYRFSPSRRMQDDICRMIDWIMISRNHNVGWLNDCDEQGRPKKLLKIGSIGQAMNEVHKGMEILSQHDPDSTYRDMEGEQTVMTFGNGYRIVQLLSFASLDREGDLLGHCIGNGDYDEALNTGEKSFYSLRDAGNRGHATFEVRNEDNTLLALQGKQKIGPIRKYMPYVHDFIRREKFELDVSAIRTHMVRQGDNYYDIMNLPDSYHHNDTLDLKRLPIKSLPENLEVDGNLLLCGSGIEKLPENLIVHGNTHLEETDIDRFPETFEFWGDINLFNSEISELPDNLFVNGDLQLSHTNISELPPGLHVKGTLRFEGTDITSIPDDLVVEGEIFCPDLTMQMNGTRFPLKLDELREMIAEYERNGRPESPYAASPQSPRSGSSFF